MLISAGRSVEKGISIAKKNHILTHWAGVLRKYPSIQYSPVGITKLLPLKIYAKSKCCYNHRSITFSLDFSLVKPGNLSLQSQ